jgi:hypothetical protein
MRAGSERPRIMAQRYQNTQ